MRLRHAWPHAGTGGVKPPGKGWSRTPRTDTPPAAPQRRLLLKAIRTPQPSRTRSTQHPWACVCPYPGSVRRARPAGTHPRGRGGHRAAAGAAGGEAAAAAAGRPPDGPRPWRGAVRAAPPGSPELGATRGSSRRHATLALWRRRRRRRRSAARGGARQPISSAPWQPGAPGDGERGAHWTAIRRGAGPRRKDELEGAGAVRRVPPRSRPSEREVQGGERAPPSGHPRNWALKGEAAPDSREGARQRALPPPQWGSVCDRGGMQSRCAPRRMASVSHPIFYSPILSHSIPFSAVPSHFIIPLNTTQFYPIPSSTFLFHPIPSNLIPFNSFLSCSFSPIPSHLLHSHSIPSHSIPQSCLTPSHSIPFCSIRSITFHLIHYSSIPSSALPSHSLAFHSTSYSLVPFHSIHPLQSCPIPLHSTCSILPHVLPFHYASITPHPIL